MAVRGSALPSAISSRACSTVTCWSKANRGEDRSLQYGCLSPRRQSRRRLEFCACSGNGFCDAKFPQDTCGAGQFCGRLVHSRETEIVPRPCARRADVFVQPFVWSVSRPHDFVFHALHPGWGGPVVVDLFPRRHSLLAVPVRAAPDRLVCAFGAALDPKSDVLRILGMLSVWRRQFADIALARHRSAAGVLLSAGAQDQNYRQPADCRKSFGVLRDILRAGIPGDRAARGTSGAWSDFHLLRKRLRFNDGAVL